MRRPTPSPRPRSYPRRFLALTSPAAPYATLLSQFDEAMVPLLAEFQGLLDYRDRSAELAAGGSTLTRRPFTATAELRSYYSGLMEKYGVGGKLRW